KNIGTFNSRLRIRSARRSGCRPLIVDCFVITVQPFIQGAALLGFWDLLPDLFILPLNNRIVTGMTL
ncbi:hypothetical protein, partial [Rosenbergiella nectarea]|uniref:hypothetical protein n=2 Tax=Rosenbergiella TaxID=1356488 RepID=UPI001BDADA8D